MDTPNLPETEAPKRDPKEPVLFKLATPVTWGKEEIAELTMRPHARGIKNLRVTIHPDGRMDYEPYALAKVGLEMAGLPGGVVDKLELKDLLNLSQEVLGFLG